MNNEVRKEKEKEMKGLLSLKGSKRDEIENKHIDFDKFDGVLVLGLDGWVHGFTLL